MLWRGDRGNRAIDKWLIQHSDAGSQGKSNQLSQHLEEEVARWASDRSRRRLAHTACRSRRQHGRQLHGRTGPAIVRGAMPSYADSSETLWCCHDRPNQPTYFIMTPAALQSGQRRPPADQPRLLHSAVAGEAFRHARVRTSRSAPFTTRAKGRLLHLCRRVPRNPFVGTPPTACSAPPPTCNDDPTPDLLPCHCPTTTPDLPTDRINSK